MKESLRMLLLSLLLASIAPVASFVVPSRPVQAGGRHAASTRITAPSSPLWKTRIPRGGATTTTATSTTNLNMFSSPMTAIATAYSYANTHHHLLTQAVTMSLFTGIGDLIAQTRQHQVQQKEHPESRRIPFQLDWARSRRFLLKGFGAGIIWTSWYRLAEGWSAALSTQAVTGLAPASLRVQQKLHTLFRTVSALLMEQFIACPIIFSCFDIPLLSALGGTPLREIPKLVRQKIGKLLVANAKVWTAVNLILYNIPLQYRVMGLSVSEMVWQAILSTISTSKQETSPAKQQQPQPNIAPPVPVAVAAPLAV